MNEPAATSTAAPVVTVRDVVKKYTDTLAVDRVSLHIQPAECYALLGPNGAGKSTLVKMITAVLDRTGGDIRVFDLDPATHAPEVKTRLGVVNQEDNLDEDLNVIKNLRVFGGFFGLSGKRFMERAEQLLEFMELTHKQTSAISALSGGMKRRLMLVRALLNQPDMLVLDEPTTGLDPQVRHAIWKSLRELKAQGMTILLTTHYMEEAAQLADRIGIIHKGTLIAEDPPEKMLAETLPKNVLEFSAVNAPPEGDPTPWTDPGSGAAVEQHGDRVYIFHDDIEQLNRWRDDAKLFRAIIRPTHLEDVFLKLTGHHLDGA